MNVTVAVVPLTVICGLDDFDVDPGRDSGIRLRIADFLRATETRPEPLQRFQVSVLERRLVAVEHFLDSARRVCGRRRRRRWTARAGAPAGPPVPTDGGGSGRLVPLEVGSSEASARAVARPAAPAAQRLALGRLGRARVRRARPPRSARRSRRCGTARWPPRIWSSLRRADHACTRPTRHVRRQRAAAYGADASGRARRPRRRRSSPARFVTGPLRLLYRVDRADASSISRFASALPGSTASTSPAARDGFLESPRLPSELRAFARLFVAVDAACCARSRSRCASVWSGTDRQDRLGMALRRQLRRRPGVPCSPVRAGLRCPVASCQLAAGAAVPVGVRCRRVVPGRPDHQRRDHRDTRQRRDQDYRLAGRTA